MIALEAAGSPLEESTQAERALERAYAAALDRRKSDAAALAALRASQDAWVAYRRAHIDSRYPAPAAEYGSIYPTCVALLAAELARQRAAELGGGCSGGTRGGTSAERLQAIRKMYAGETPFLDRLEAAQRAWERFRGLEFAALGATAGREPPAGCGAALDASRARLLAPWVEGVLEGDVCAGSLRRKADAGTIRSMSAGDRACYVEFTDDEGRDQEEMADFSLCERKKELLGKRARFEWEIANVQAASCQGNPDCSDTEQAALIRAATPEPGR